MMAKAETKTREAERGRLAKQRADVLEDRLANVMRASFASGEIAYIGGLEGPLRHGIRAKLCLGGWHWRDADKAAQVTVENALRRVRAMRPTWYEGQPEWTIREGMLIERTRCVKCHKPLPPENYKFCGHLCRGAHNKRMEALRNGQEDTVLRIATRSI